MTYSPTQTQDIQAGDATVWTYAKDWERRYNNTHDVTDFGSWATTNAPAVNRATMEAAIDAVTLTGGRILVPEGTFPMEPAAYKDNVWIQGSGPGTILQLGFADSVTNANYPGKSLFYPANRSTGYTDYVAISDMTLDGNESAITFVDVGDAHGLVVRGTRWSFFWNLWIKNAHYDGILVSTEAGGTSYFSEEVVFDRIWMETIGRNGYTIQGCTRGLFTNTVVRDPHQVAAPGYAIDLDGAGGAVNTDILVRGLLASGVRNGIGVVVAGSHIRIADAHIRVKDTSGQYGITIANVSQVSLSDITVHHGSDATVEACHFDTVTDLDIDGLTVYDANREGIHLDTVTRYRARHIFVKDAQRDGIKVSSGDGVLVDCSVLDANQATSTYDAYSLNGTTKLRGCRAEGTTHRYAISLGATGDGNVILEGGEYPAGTSGAFNNATSYSLEFRNVILGTALFHGQYFQLASEATATFRAIGTNNEAIMAIQGEDGTAYRGIFSGDGTNVPVSLASGAKVSYQTATGGTSSDDVLRVWPATANTISVKNNTASAMFVTLAPVAGAF